VRAAVITNPHSARNRRHAARVSRLLDDAVIHRVCDSVADIPGVLEEFTAANVDVIGINGGDGTIHQVITALGRSRTSAELPMLALLPGGTTNMSARDLNGGPLSLERALEAFVESVRHARAPTLREIIRVSDDSGQERLGFCFGIGAVIRGIEYCHERIFALGIREEWASGVAMARAAWGSRRNPSSRKASRSRRDRREDHAGNASIFLVSALRSLFLGIRPFWGDGPDPLAMTWVAEDAHRFLRRFPALLRGDGGQLPESDGYLSRRVRRVEVSGDEHYQIDGEIYHAPGGRLALDAYGPVRILALGAGA
jgi:hypothetical protein